MVITPSPCLKVKQAIEHPGQFSVGTTLKNWSIFGRRQQPPTSSVGWQIQGLQSWLSGMMRVPRILNVEKLVIFLRPKQSRCQLFLLLRSRFVVPASEAEG